MSDEVLDRFCMVGTYETIAERVGERLGGIVDRVSLPLPGERRRPARDEIAGAVEALQALADRPSAPRGPGGSLNGAASPLPTDGR